MKWKYLEMVSQDEMCRNIRQYGATEEEKIVYKGTLNTNHSYALDTFGRFQWELVSVDVVRNKGDLSVIRHFFFKRPVN